MKIDNLMLNKKRFHSMVEDCVRKKRLTYIDAIVHICEENNLEVEDMKKYITGPMKEKIEVEAQRLHYLPKGNELPFE
jgi:hypothetical protein